MLLLNPILNKIESVRLLNLTNSSPFATMTKINNNFENKNFCLCGCGQLCKNKYVNGHNSKGSTHSNWRGGIAYNHTNKYKYIKKPDHPFATKQGYVYESHLVFEHYLKILFDEDIYIPKEIDIHHENENTLDNSLINLTPVTKDIHQNIHKIGTYKDMSDRFCLLCGSNETWNRKWHKYNDEFICNKCRCKKYYHS